MYKYNGFIIEKTGQIDEFGFPVLVKRPDPDAKPAKSEPVSAANITAAKLTLEYLSGGKNTIITDDLGQPSVMVRIPAFKWSDVIDGAPDEVCSAFVVNGRKLSCIYVSKFLNTIVNGRAYSIPNVEPAHTLKIDEAREACAAKGRGWHLMTNAEWAAIAHWCRKNGTIPHGNTRYGADVYHPHETAVEAQGELYERDIVTQERPDAPERTLSGTSPASWSHDGTDFGIFDLTGNLWDYVSGLRIVDGEIQIIPDNDSALNVDESENSTAWKAVLQDGSLVEPGTPGTLKFDGVSQGRSDDKNVGVPGGVKLNTKLENFQYTGDAPDQKHMAYTFGPWETLPAETGVEIPFILKALAIMPVSPDLGTEISGGKENPQIYFIRNYGERTCARGSSWIGGNGFWYLYLRESREFIYPDIGFRSAYIDLN